MNQDIVVGYCQHSVKQMKEHLVGVLVVCVISLILNTSSDEDEVALSTLIKA